MDVYSYYSTNFYSILFFDENKTLYDGYDSLYKSNNLFIV